MIAEQEGGLLIKLQHSIVGLPDRVLVVPHQPMRFIEFKQPEKGFASQIQLFWMRRLGAMGHPVMVFDNVEEFRHAISRGG